MRRLTSIIAGLSLVLTLGVGSVFAASPSEQECLEAGGTFDRTQGVVSCTFVTVDPVGNSENSGGHSQTRDTTEKDSSNGTLNNDPQFEESSECSGPGNSNNC
jgi:hypothetical protein